MGIQGVMLSSLKNIIGYSPLTSCRHIQYELENQLAFLSCTHPRLHVHFRLMDESLKIQVARNPDSMAEVDELGNGLEQAVGTFTKRTHELDEG